MSIKKPSAVESIYVTTTDITPVKKPSAVNSLYVTTANTTGPTPVKKPSAVNLPQVITDTNPVTKPSTVDSPYVTTDTTPTKLAAAPVAGGGISTVVAAVANTVSADANTDTSTSSTGSNVSYYASGIEGIAGLANQGRVFEGANVYVTLEQQQYNTYNQTIGIGNSISVTGNITTSSGYFIGNGSQLTGIAVSYGNANVVANLAALGSNPVSTTGNVTAGYFVGNGSQLTGLAATYGNANVVANLAALGTNPVSTTGNVTAGNLLTGAQVVASGVIQSGTGFSTGGYLSVDGDTDLHKTNVTGNLSATGNITGSYVLGNGSQLTGLAATYSNANVITLLSSLGSNIISGTGNITTTANISGGYILGNGSQLSGLPATYGNANVVANLAALGSNPVSTTGNVTAGYFIGNGSTLSSLVGGNVTGTVANATYAVSAGSATSATTSGTVTTAAQSNITSVGILSSLSSTGNVAGNYILGNGSQLTSINAVTVDITDTNGLTTVYYPTFVENRTTAQIARADVDLTYRTDDNLLTVGNVSVTGNITGAYILGNGSQLTGLPATYGNANVATFLAAYGSNTVSTTGNITTGNLLTGGLISATSTITGTSHLGSVVSVTGNVTGGNVLTGGVISSTGNITGGNISATNHTGTTVSVTGNITAANFFGNGNTLSNVATRFESAWTVPVGNSTQSFTVAASETYYLWVDCNIPNGILVWNATATVTNTNVPVVGQQFAWVYNGGGSPIDFTSIPDQFVGTANTIVRSSVAPSATTNRFDFGLNNTSGGNVTVRYGWVAIS